MNKSIETTIIPITPIAPGLVGLIVKILRSQIERKNETIKQPSEVMIDTVEFFNEFLYYPESL